MPCTQPNAPIINITPIAGTSDWVDLGAENDRHLFVSNAPENIPSFAGADAVLYRVPITVAPSSVLKLRCFVWHFSTEEPRNLSLIIRSVQSLGTVLVRNHKSMTFAGADISSYTTCLSQAMLFGTLDADSINDVNIVPAAVALGTYQLPKSANKDSPAPVASVHEFEVHGDSFTSLIHLWTVVHNGSALPSYSTQIANPGLHIRGCGPIAQELIHARRSST
jgi:hypothetical protein